MPYLVFLAGASRLFLMKCYVLTFLSSFASLYCIKVTVLSNSLEWYIHYLQVTQDSPPFHHSPNSKPRRNWASCLPSQWGMVHLFDLCLRFGLVDTASALALRGVEGCVLEDHHDLGPFSTSCSDRLCDCQGWDTCRYCCWVFPVEQGIWMEDWDMDLVVAIPAAQKAAATPVTRAMLDICSRHMEFPVPASANAVARLLDISILTGNRKAAVKLAQKCQVWPLRRWALDWESRKCWEAARTALWAWANFKDLIIKDAFLSIEDLMVGCRSEDIPFPQGLFLRSTLEDWQEICHLLPAKRCQRLWKPRNLDNGLGNLFLEGPHRHGVGEKLSLDKIRAAEDAGVDVRFCCASVCEVAPEDYEFGVHLTGIMKFCMPVTLLDMAIWCGQPNCAEACVDGGIKLEGGDRTLAWHKRVLHGENLSLGISLGIMYHPRLDVVPSEAQRAAAAAGCASLKRLWKSHSQKGIVLHQMFKGRSSLVQEILTYFMKVPKIIDQLDLREHVGDWMAAICGRPTSGHPAADCKTAKVEDPEGMQRNGEAEDNGEAGTQLYIGVLVFFFIVCVEGSRLLVGTKRHEFLSWHVLSNKVNDPFRRALETRHWKMPHTSETTNFNQKIIHRSIVPPPKFLCISIVFQPNPPVFHP